MIVNNLDERMLIVRGKALLYGFICMIILIVLKNMSVDLFGFSMESETRTDFAIIFLSTFLVVSYMLIHDAVSDQVMKRTRFIFPILSILFLFIVVIQVVSGEGETNIKFISIFDTSVVELISTLTYTMFLMKKIHQLKHEGKEN